jgi:hypothetical protein
MMGGPETSVFSLGIWGQPRDSLEEGKEWILDDT